MTKFIRIPQLIADLIAIAHATAPGIGQFGPIADDILNLDFFAAADKLEKLWKLVGPAEEAAIRQLIVDLQS